MEIDWTTLTGFTTTVAGSALTFATAMAAIGVLSMAVIQTLKDMLPVRKWFHIWRLKEWLKEKATKALNVGEIAPDVEKAEEDLIRLATAGDRAAFYDLAIEQLCGQMNAAAQVVLEYPIEHVDLLRCLAALAEKADIDELLRPHKNKSEKTKTEEQIDARTRIIHQVQRSIDGLQISAGFRWKWLLQVTSFAVSFVLTFIGFSFHAKEGIAAGNVAAFIFAGLVGGFFAPVARDLVAALQKLRS